MTSTSFLEDALFEHRFWLQILGDHSRFILNTLSPNERDKIQTSRQFIAIFDELLEESRRELSENQLEDLTVRAQARAMEIREFKLNLIRDHILGMITIELTPTFINHMVNEVEEYLYNIYLIINKQMPYMNPLHDHSLQGVGACHLS